MGSYYPHEPGASAGWLVKVPTDKVKQGAAAVKVWCVPAARPPFKAVSPCSPDRIRSQIQLVLAQQVMGFFNKYGGGGNQCPAAASTSGRVPPYTLLNIVLL